MAKFCINCGKTLDESGRCSCQNAVIETQAVPKPSYGETAPRAPEYSNTYHREVDYSQKANQAKEVLSTGYNQVMGVLMNLLRHPFSKGIPFSNSEDLKSASMIVGLHALVVAIFTTVAFSRMNQVLEGLSEMFMALSGYDEFIDISFPLINIFIITLMGSAIFSVIYAGTLLLFSIIFKNNVSFKTTLCAVASRSAVIIPVVLCALVLLFVVPSLAFPIFFLGNIAGVAYITQVFPVTKQENRNHVPLIVFLGTALFLFAVYIIMINSYSVYLPEGVKDLLPYFEEILNDPTSIYGW